jgi:antitoxin component of RelBE/YafQ-DinJ toxin-antitoxin module
MYIAIVIQGLIMKDEVIIIRVEPQLKKDLQQMADKDNRTLSDYVRLQLKKLVENYKLKK